jgi:hypothetical protein
MSVILESVGALRVDIDQLSRATRLQLQELEALLLVGTGRPMICLGSCLPAV